MEPLEISRDPGAPASPRPRLPAASPVTRFAPAPTGDLHLGHLVNAIYTWGIARATRGRVILRIEDHDRQRSRPVFERGILDDLERLGLRPDLPDLADFRGGSTPYRQSDNGAAYDAAVERLDSAGLVYACACTRSTFAAHRARTGAPWTGPGCPGGCRGRAGVGLPPGATLRVALGEGTESWVDLLAGPQAGNPAAGGDPAIRDRHGNWTYLLCVVVDDLRQGVTLVIRGRDLLASTPAQIRLARALGRERMAAFVHHPLVRTPDGRKLSKADGSTSIRSMLDAGWTPAGLFGRAAHLAGLLSTASPVAPDDLAGLFT